MKFFVFRRLAMFVLACGAMVGCATFEGEIPIELSIPDTTYISPRNGDGIQDELVIPLQVPELANLIVQGYRFSVLDADGVEVFSLSEEPKENSRRASVSIPAALVWGGVDSNGDFVEDAEYSYTIEAWDRNDNRGKTVARYVVVDNTPPRVSVYTSYPLFSPDNDGRLDTLYISQVDATDEDEWFGAFIDDMNQTVRVYAWSGRPGDFSWDGRNDEGDLVADGEYRYVLESTDRAGNAVSAGIPSITIDTEPTEVVLHVDIVEFSPNGDGVKDTVTFLPSVKVTRNVKVWRLDIIDRAGAVRRSFSGAGPVPQRVEFDGTNGAGGVFVDGVYRGVLSVEYNNGSEPSAPSPSVTLDTTRPYAALSVPYFTFSPDGDERKDFVEIRQSTSVEDNWSGTILDSSRRVVRSYSWQGRGSMVSWDGKNQSGIRAADGAYTYTLSATDRAGNNGEYSVAGIVLDTRATPVSIVSAVGSFSPNGDGVKDTAAFDVTAAIGDGVTDWSLQILSSSRAPIRTLKGSGNLPPKIAWDGKHENGSVVDGTYSARLLVEYAKGNVATAETKTQLLVDTTPPAITLKSTPKPFSPDSDGVDDELRIAVSAKDSSDIEQWRADIIDPAGNLFTFFSGDGAPPSSISWNGRAANGELVQSAEDYTIRFSARDAVWNIATVTDTIPVDILVIKDGDRLKIVISSIYFKPFTADYLSDPAEAKRNISTLDRLSEILKKYAQHQIRIEGHAVRIYWNDPKRLEVEEKEVLSGLSQDRADVIKAALVERGIKATRMTTQGFGGTNPVVPHSDLDNRWKNRRVEFILVRGN